MQNILINFKKIHSPRIGHFSDLMNFYIICPFTHSYLWKLFEPSQRAFFPCFFNFPVSPWSNSLCICKSLSNYSSSLLTAIISPLICRLTAPPFRSIYLLVPYNSFFLKTSLQLHIYFRLSPPLLLFFSYPHFQHAPSYVVSFFSIPLSF